MDIAKKLNAADVYIELDRKNPEAQWAQLKEDYKYGFDVVVSRTACVGAEMVAEPCRLKPLVSKSSPMTPSTMCDEVCECFVDFSLCSRTFPPMQEEHS